MSGRAMTWAWEQDAPANEKIVLLALCDQSRDDGAVQLAQADVCAMTGAKTRTVRDNLNRLEERGLLKRYPYHEHGQRIPDVIKVAVDGSTDLPADFAGRRAPAGFSGRQLADPAGGTGRIGGYRQDPPDSSSSTTSQREEEDEGRARQMPPEGAFDAVEEFVPEEARADALSFLKQKKKVDGRLVTPEEMARAAAIVAEFNRQAGSEFGLGGQVVRVVMRIRERPSMDAAKHVRLVQSAFRLKWWERNGRSGRRATPAVIYGNAEVFEQVVQDAVDEAKGRQLDEAPAAKRKRFTRED